MDTQKVHAKTSSMPSDMTKSEKDKTTPCRHVFKTPLPKYLVSPPGAPHPRRVILPKQRQKTEPPSPTPDGSRRKNYNRDSLARNRIVSHELEDMSSRYHDVIKQYWNLIGEAHNQNDDTKANESMSDIQFHGNSTKPAWITAQKRCHITSDSKNVPDSEETFCQVNKAERNEEASFW